MPDIFCFLYEKLLYPQKHRKRDLEIEEEKEGEDDYDYNQLEVDSAVGQHEFGLVSALFDRASGCELCTFVYEKIEEHFDQELPHRLRSERKFRCDQSWLAGSHREKAIGPDFIYHLPLMNVEVKPAGHITGQSGD